MQFTFIAKMSTVVYKNSRVIYGNIYFYNINILNFFTCKMQYTSNIREEDCLHNLCTNRYQSDVDSVRRGPVANREKNRVQSTRWNPRGNGRKNRSFTCFDDASQTLIYGSSLKASQVARWKEIIYFYSTKFARAEKKCWSKLCVY